MIETDITELSIEEIIFDIKQFAVDHNLIFETQGEVGFGRACVGLISRGGSYLDYNPIDYIKGEFVEYFPRDNRLSPPPNLVPDAYHKHDCLAVLVHGDDYEKAIRQLYSWILYLRSQGEVEIREYEKQHDNMYSLFLHGPTGYALCFKDTKQDA